MYYTLNTYETICEACRKIDDEWLKLESIHPIDIITSYDTLNEAGISKMQIEKTLDAIITAIKAAIKKFKDITRTLRQKNAEWIVQAEKFNYNGKDAQNFREEIFPYWNAIPSVFNGINIPNFDIRNIESYNDGTFMTSNFKSIIDENGVVNKNILRGINSNSANKSGKIAVEYRQLATVYPKVINTIKAIDTLRDKVARDMGRISTQVERVKNGSVPMTESVMLEYSMFKNEYYDILLEAMTPDDIDKAENVSTTTTVEKKINIDPENNKQASDFKTACDAVTKYSKLCSSVTTAEMDILDEAYTACVRFIEKAMKK